MESIENINKINKKLGATAKRILKLRNKRGTELKHFDKIDELMQCPDIEPQPRANNVDVGVEVKIPEHAPGLSLIDLSQVDCLFSENGIKLKNFVAVKQTLFGHSLLTITDSRFRKLLLARIYELRITGVSEDVSLYVLHLLSCTTNAALAFACTEFLHRFPCAITTAHVIPILLNLGISSDSLWDSGFQYKVPKHFASEKRGRDTLPIYNMEKVFDYLSFCIEENLMKCDAAIEPLITGFAKLPLDRHISGTPLVPCVSRFVSLLSQRSSVSLGCNVVANKLLQGVYHPLNQLEIFRIVVRPDAPLKRALLRYILQSNTNKTFSLRTSFGMQDLRKVILACKQQVDPLQTFVSLHLLIDVVSMLKFTAKDIEVISNELSSIEIFAKSLSASDHMRLHSACAQLRGLIMMARLI